MYAVRLVQSQVEVGDKHFLRVVSLWLRRDEHNLKCFRSVHTFSLATKYESKGRAEADALLWAAKEPLLIHKVRVVKLADRQRFEFMIVRLKVNGKPGAYWRGNNEKCGGTWKWVGDKHHGQHYETKNEAEAVLFGIATMNPTLIGNVEVVKVRAHERKIMQER